MSAAHGTKGLVGWSSGQGSGQVTVQAQVRARFGSYGGAGGGDPLSHPSSNRVPVWYLFTVLQTTWVRREEKEQTRNPDPLQEAPTTVMRPPGAIQLGGFRSRPGSNIQGWTRGAQRVSTKPQRGKVPKSLAFAPRGILALHLTHHPCPRNTLSHALGACAGLVSLPAPCCPRFAARPWGGCSLVPQTNPWVFLVPCL